MDFSKIISVSLLALLVSTTGLKAQEILLPIGHKYRNQDFTLENTKTIVGDGFFPVTQGDLDSVYHLKTDKKDGGWFGRKLFHEHFVELRGEDYFLAIDPLINAHIGQEKGDFENNIYQNTRAFQVFGQVMDNFSFYTAFFENQARFADYKTNYFEDRGEQRFRENLGYYDTINATIPGGGRTKPFKEDGFDYSSAVSYIRYRPTESFAVQFGNNPNFVGWGHRSMLLSDNSFNATQLKTEWQINDQLKFSTIHAKHLNLFRRIRRLGDTTYVTTVEEPFEKKNYTAKYLSYQPTENFTVGLFEAQVYYREDSIHSEWMHPLYFNPLPLLNTAIFGWENSSAKSLLGLNFAWGFMKNSLLYGQFVTDELSSSPDFGAQLGVKSNHFLGVQHLFLQLEMNHATNSLYAAQNRRLAYTHYNLPLAHTLGNGFTESIAKVHYEFKRIYLELGAIYYEANSPIQNMSSLFDVRGNIPDDFNRTLLGEVELGYVFNKRTHLSLFAKAVYRQSESEISGNQNTALVFGGLKTRVFNRNFDF